MGICSLQDTQMLFLDTPGFSRSSQLSSILWEACQDADIVCYLIDATRGWQTKDTINLKKLSVSSHKKNFVIGTKTDRIKKHDLFKISQDFKKNLGQISENINLVMLSAKQSESVKVLLAALSQSLPSSDWMYDENAITDCSDDFICSEFIREQLFRNLGEELPYSTNVYVEKIEKKPKITVIHATINVVRESQKAILIGQHGSRLKTIGQSSRESLESHFGKKVFLKLFVKKGDI